MVRFLFISLVALATCLAQGADPPSEKPIVFKTEVSLARVDAQVVDRQNRAITGLRPEDFILTENGERKDIRNFASEDMPVDILLLLDVSGSMRPHVQRIADASSTALQVLGDEDRVAIMVFDRSTRLRLPFRRSLEGVERELANLLNEETFDGGTDITRALYDAARYMQRNGRRDARRAIVILTDDQTERGRDEAGVGRALAQADTVMSALIAPDAMGYSYPRRGGGGGGGGWPGTGWPGVGGPLGGIILGRRGPLGGGGGPIIVGAHTGSAGTSEIARASGGDSLRVDEASALQRTLERLRQRYALHYHAGETAGNVAVHLTDAARRRYPDAEVRFRRVNLGSDSTVHSEPVQVSRGRAPASASAPPPATDSQTSDEDRPPAPRRRRPAVDDTGSRSGPLEQQPAATGEAGWRKTGQSKPAGGAPPQSAPADERGGWRKAGEAKPAEESSGGWRTLKPGEKP